MRTTVLVFLSAAAMLAQPRAGTPLYPGGAPGPKSPTPSVLRPGTPTQVNRPAGPGLVGNSGRPATSRQSRRTVILPYGIPYYGGNGSYQDEYAAQPPIVVQAAPPVVYINRDYQPERLSPVMRDYSNVPLPEAVPQESNPIRVYDAPFYIDPRRDADEPTIYLLALRDQTVLPALAYWVEGDTLRYVTRQHAMNVISLDLIDRPFSAKLNRERNVEFKLP